MLTSTTETIKYVRREEKPIRIEVRRPNPPADKTTVRVSRAKSMMRFLPGAAEGILYQHDTQARPFVAGHGADVYRGKWVCINGSELRVAIKLVKTNVAREAGVWLRLDHPNLVPLIAFVEERSLLISRFYDRGNLGTFLGQNPGINLGQRLSLVLGIGAGLESLHSQKIVHGDVKPSNVLIDDDGAPLISDFGISQVLDLRGYTTASVGTRAYIAPELWEKFLKPQRPKTGAWTTKASDMYSFGILGLETLSSVQRSEVNPSAPYQPRREEYTMDTVPGKLWAVLEPCWALNPKSRPRISNVLGELRALHAALKYLSG
ncbi:kinase-like domain-containing protein [Mycena vulgaris]|nr:kinase-like domain-containing protein [Mycena vulgaris]